MKYQGYTLIEVMIVIGLLVVILNLTLTSITTDTALIARSELYKIYSICSYLQMRARATNQLQQLIFDCIDNSYSYNGVTETLAKGIVFGVLDGAKGPPCSPTHFIINPITSENQCITFTPHGIIQPGTIYIKTIDNQHMYALSVAVAQASFLRMYTYSHGSWTIIK